MKIKKQKTQKKSVMKQKLKFEYHKHCLKATQREYEKTN